LDKYISTVTSVARIFVLLIRLRMKYVFTLNTIFLSVMGCACVRLSPDQNLCSVKLSILLFQSCFDDEDLIQSVFFAQSSHL